MIFPVAATLSVVLLRCADAIPLDTTSTHSLKVASASLAHQLMSWYTNNHTGTPATAVGTLPQPLYWWEAGAVWGGLIDYWAYTGDDSFNPTITQALLAQTGPNDNFMPPAYFSSLGNDDQAFWAIAALNANEYGFPVPHGHPPTFWRTLAENVFNTMVPRWLTNTCHGGLMWQIFTTNPGWGYKNSISNGGFLQVAARLARSTGNHTYVDWAEKIWDWMEGVGFIDHDYTVYDGAGATTGNCTDIDKAVYSYNPAMLMYGAATMFKYTGQKVWEERTSGLMTSVTKTFFSPYKNSTDIMFEPTCEPFNNCDNDQLSFKAYLARWMAQSAMVVPAIKKEVTTLLTASAHAAAFSCSGGASKNWCGQKWYVGRYDGHYGIGQQLSALETIQSLLLLGVGHN